ncbi:MAG: hypothetical protein Q9226_009419, partial [Calogaya cf. arnoldii]
EEAYLANLASNVVCPSIAALTVGICGQGVKIGTISSDLQLWARIDNTHGFLCPTSPTKIVIPMILNTTGTAHAAPDCGSEDRQGNISPPAPQTQVQSKDKVKSADKAKSAASEKWPSGIGHWIVAIATKEAARVSLKFYNSVSYGTGPGYDASENVVRRIARNIVRYSGWMGTTTPEWHGESFIKGSQQGWMNTCGTHVVFNAWADVLGLDVNPDMANNDSERFYRDARELMDTAMAGNSSSGYIEAWLVTNGWVRPRGQQLYPGSDLAKILQANTCQMSDSLFEKHIVHEVEEAVIEASAAIQTASNLSIPITTTAATNLSNPNTPTATTAATNDTSEAPGADLSTKRKAVNSGSEDSELSE